METRNESFQSLKPACVALSQATLTFAADQKTFKQVTACLEDLDQVVRVLGRRPDYLDSKLADYVFFPLSQVLKASRHLPVRAMELSLHILAILLSKGWRENIDQSLSSQLVIFLSLTCDTSGKTIAVSQVTDELRVAAYVCMKNLFESIRTNATAKSALVATANVPSLGHTVAVVLDGVSESLSFEVQNAAAEALQGLLGCIEDIEVLSSFFPGIVSLLTKILTPNTKIRRNWKILIQGLAILNSLFRALLSNKVVANLSKVTHNDKDTSKTLTTSWAIATASQIKVALANIERLRSHARPEVRESLANLNLTILEDCNDALKDCCHMALGTLLMLLDQDLTLEYEGKARLEVLVHSKPVIADILASVFHDELLSLTRVMQANDDQAKERNLKQIFNAYSILTRVASDTRLLSRMLGRGLRDSITTILQSSGKAMISSQEDSLLLSELPQLEASEGLLDFSTPLTKHKGQKELLNLIEAQLIAVREAQIPIGVAYDLTSGLRALEGDVQVASFWLVLRDLQASDSTSDILDTFLSLDDNTTNQGRESLKEQLYSLSLDIITDVDADWRLKTLALETIAMQARHCKEDFRGELVDALYPILHHLGSDVAQVRGHAITCLNIVSDACGYADVKELVVSNVDYLVNAVALKLNSFDVSPQGPQVLLMMVQLSGPSLLPYLEDTLESIFAALEDYHGYPALVALLFAVLKAMAEEGVKSPQLQIEAGASGANGAVSAWAPTTIQDLLANVRESATKKESEPTSLPDDVPRQPWKQLDSNFEQVEAELRRGEENEAGANEDDDDSASTEQSLPPAPKTYAFLLKIVTLTEHYLSSSSSSLRISLLALIRTTIPALAKHENSYLPLINTLWPELTSRLFDTETHVVAATLQTIDIMCEYAGGFMRTRVVALWPELVTMYRQVSKEVKTSSSSSSSRRSQSGEMTLLHTDVGYVDVSTKAVWQSLTALLKTVIKHVGVDADIFDDVLNMLLPVQQTLDADTMAVLEEYNADAVWLAQYRGGNSCGLEKTKIESSGDWRFVELSIQ